MANTMKVKHGNAVPTINELQEFEMGFCESDNFLYVNKSGSVVKIGVGLSFDQIYPIGCIYTSIVNTDPGTLFGGTWAQFAAGRVLVGVDSAEESFNTVEKLGGEMEHILDVSQLPPHTHTQQPHTHIQDAHTHIQDSHSHSIDHDHLSFTSDLGGGSHSHSLTIDNDTHSHAWTYTNSYKHSSTDYDSVTTAYGSSGSGPSNTHNHTGTIGSANIDHTHDIDVPAYTGSSDSITATNQSTTATNQETIAVNNSTGDGSPHNNLQPYITVYMWKRTA